MAEIAESEQLMLERVTRSQKPMAIVGAVLALTGAAYLTWGVMRFDPGADPRLSPGFDWPVARLSFLFERGQFIVDNAQPQSPTEKRLLDGLSSSMIFSAGVIVLMLRILLATVAVVSGFAIMTVVVERARLIAIIRQLRE